MDTKEHNNFTLVDVETTGMKPDYNRVIDIGIIRIENGVVVERFESFVNPGVSIPLSITGINGITDEDVASAPTFEEIADRVEKLFEDSIFVAHNASFDYGFIKQEFRRIGIDFKKQVLCSVKLSRSLYPHEMRHNLDALISRHGFTCSTRHRAMPDTEVIEQFLTHSEKAFSKKVLEKHIEKVLFTEGIPKLLDRKLLAQLPDTPGVYFFYGKDNELLYIGKSKNIRTRVRSHFSDSTSRKEMKLCAETARVEAEITAGELGALLYESHLIKERLPAYNRALRKLTKLVVAKKIIRADGYATVDISRTDNVEMQSGIIGLFRSVSQAKTKLRDLAKEHTLCQLLLGLEKGSSCFGFQLQSCNGACMQKEDPKEYNARFDTAFKQRRIRTWPFTGPIMIEEKGFDETTGAVFFVDEWRLIKSYIYENGEEKEFIQGAQRFDYDMYKILARYILNPGNKRTIKSIKPYELSQALNAFSGDYEVVID